MSTLLFVYGTLKSGFSNHAQLSGQRWVATAETQPGYRLYDLGDYPGMVAAAEDREGVIGEVWSVDAATLERLDRFEGVHEGLYRRESVALQPPFSSQPVETYLFARSVAGRPAVGREWRNLRR